MKIEEIKKMKNNGYRGWSIHLIPYCREYFESKVSISYVRSELLDIYQIDIPIVTLKYIKKKYLAQRQNTSMPKGEEKDRRNSVDSTSKPFSPNTKSPPNHPSSANTSKQEQEDNLEATLKAHDDYLKNKKTEKTEFDHYADFFALQRKDKDFTLSWEDYLEQVSKS